MQLEYKGLIGEDEEEIVKLSLKDTLLSEMMEFRELEAEGNTYERFDTPLRKSTLNECQMMYAPKPITR